MFDSCGPSMLLFHIIQTFPCNEDHLTPYFNMVKLGFTWLYIFVIFAIIHRLWVLVRILQGHVFRNGFSIQKLFSHVTYLKIYQRHERERERERESDRETERDSLFCI